MPLNRLKALMALKRQTLGVDIAAGARVVVARTAVRVSQKTKAISQLAVAKLSTLCLQLGLCHQFRI